MYSLLNKMYRKHKVLDNAKLAKVGLCLSTCFHQPIYAGTKSFVESKKMDIKSFDGILLSGTLTLPIDKKPKAIVIPVHGSFVQTRDGDLDKNKTWMFPEGAPKRQLFLDMSNELIKIGYGTYRYDKRASGESGGNYSETDMVMLAQDIAAVVSAIKEKFPGVSIGLVGQSEGALSVLKSWDLGVRPDFIILQGPALEPFDVTIEFQRTHGAAPFLAEGLKGPLSLQYPYLAALYHALFYENMLQKMKSGSCDYYDLNWNDYQYRTNLKKYREYLWNGLDLLKTVNVPVLLVIGDRDGNVRPEAAKHVIARQAHGDYLNISVKILDGLEHSFREVKENETFIDAMAKPLSPKYLEALQSFLASLSLSSCANFKTLN